MMIATAEAWASSSSDDDTIAISDANTDEEDPASDKRDSASDNTDDVERKTTGETGKGFVNQITHFDSSRQLLFSGCIFKCHVGGGA